MKKHEARVEVGAALLYGAPANRFQTQWSFMAASKQPAAAPAADESKYPTIESFIETATPDEISALLQPIRDQLQTLKGPKADLGKKVGKAVERSQELLEFLLQVRERLETEKPKGSKSRR